MQFSKGTRKRAFCFSGPHFSIWETWVLNLAQQQPAAA
jgi:hypothetical protein